MPESIGNQTAQAQRGPVHNNYFRSHFNSPHQIRQLLILAMSKEQVECFDFDTICVLPSTLSDTEQLTEKHSDLIISCHLKSGGKVIINIVIEAKSSSDSGLMRQLLGYMARLYGNDASAVLALTVFHGKSKWRVDKTFHEFEHARLPREFVGQFRDYLIDFRTIFVSLGDRNVNRRMQRLPLKERLALQVLAEIWEAGAASFAKWLQKAANLPEQQLVEFIKSTYIYLSKVHKAVTIEEMKEAIEAKKPGDEKMAQVMRLWEGVMPETLAEAEAQGMEKGIEKGMEKGMEKTLNSVALRMLRDGFDVNFIRKYCELNEEQIRKLKISALG